MRLTAKPIYKASILALLMAAQLSPFLATPAQAFELFGIHLWGEKKPKVDPDAVIAEPKNYDVEVVVSGVQINPNGKNDDSKAVIEAASGLFADQDKPASGSAGLLAKARGDYRRILASLYGEGRYGGTISILVDGRQASDIPPDAELPDHVNVVIDVDPGPQFLFSRASIVNMAPPPATPRRDQVQTPEEAGFVDGAVAKSGTILKAEVLAVEAWRQQGYAKARMSDEQVTADHADNRVAAVITIDPGRHAKFGPVTVEGAERMDPAFVAWMTGLKEGEDFDPADLERAKKRLARMEVFRAMSFQEAEAISPDGLLPMTLNVQERKPRRFGVGASYSTLDGFGAEAYWMHRNLMGKGERLRFDGKISGIGGSQKDSFNPKNYTYLLGTSFTKPGVFTPDTDLVASLNARREVIDAYTETSVNLKGGFTHIFSDELSGSAYANVGRSHFDDDYFGKRQFTTIGLQGTLLYDGRDDKNDAKNGLYGELYLEPFYEATYGNFINKFTAEGRGYYSLGPSDRITLAGRAKIGSIVGADIGELPPDKLFFAGGGGSIRGYAYRNVGVVTSTGEIIGGRSLVEVSGEVRTKVTESIGVVAFADAGYVGEKSYPDFSEKMRVGVGAGLRYHTGLGPIRFDTAVPLDRGSGDPKISFYVGIGQSF
ncbi:autotransporter assembly complex protein TamA [Brucellaceae bacterium C25G]